MKTGRLGGGAVCARTCPGVDRLDEVQVVGRLNAKPGAEKGAATDGVVGHHP